MKKAIFSLAIVTALIIMMLPADIAVDSITDFQMGKLKHLKAWLYRQRIKVRTERDGEERKQQKEQDELRKKAEHPALFEL